MDTQILLQELDNRKGQLDSQRPFPDTLEQQIWDKLRLEWNYNSNHIEGSTLTYGETKLLLTKGEVSGNHEVQKVDEMRAHDMAVEDIKRWAADKERTISESDIRQLNETILVRPYWKEAITDDGQPTRRKIKIGEYKQFPNHVRLANGEIFRYSEPANVSKEMKELLDWYRAESEILHPVAVAAILHYRFVKIHPFDDGNGRVARLLMNYHLMSNGYPPIIIKSSDKMNYLQALNKADLGELQVFVEYIIKQLDWSLKLFEKAVKGEEIEESNDWIKKVELLKKRLNNPESVQPKNPVYLEERFPDSFLYLYEILHTELEKLNPLFAHFNTTFTVMGGEPFPGNYTFREALEKQLQNYIALMKIERISFSIGWEGFKDINTVPFSVSVQIEIDLRDNFRYKIICGILGNKPYLSKLYTSELSVKEINSLVQAIGKRLVEIIETRITSN